MKQIAEIEGKLHEIDDENASYIESTALDSCNGDACGIGTVTWTGNGYRIKNTHSTRRVRVRVRFLTGLQCGSWSSIDLDPGTYADYGNPGFCHPYEATYI